MYFLLFTCFTTFSTLLAITKIPLNAHRFQSNEYLTGNSGIGSNSKVGINASLLGLYTLSINLGTPAQEFVVQLDSSIGDFWLVGKDCKSDYCKQAFEGYNKHLYDWTKSSTSIKDGRKFAVEYANGNYFKDTLQIGDLIVSEQIFGAANRIENALYIPIDGILGVGWSADDSIPNILQGLTNSTNLEQTVFTLWLGSQPKRYPLPNNGQLTIGALDLENCENDWDYQPLTSDFYWQFETEGFEIGKYSRQINRTAMSLTAEPFIYLSDEELKLVIKATGAVFDDAYGVYVVPCAKIPTLPDIKFTIQQKAYIIKAIDYTDIIALPGEDRCMLLVNISDDEFYFDIIVLGQPFLRVFCHAYNWTNHTIGLSTAKH